MSISYDHLSSAHRLRSLVDMVEREPVFASTDTARGALFPKGSQ